MNSGHRSDDSGQPDADPADQWVLDPETGEFRLRPDAARRAPAGRAGVPRAGAARAGAAAEVPRARPAGRA
ncbi:hypothetical protein CG736_35495, partial [Kitasatospora sp. CB02891]